MSLLHFLFIQLNLVLFFGLYLLLDSGKRHRGFNRFYLLLAPLFATVLPFLSLPENQTVEWASTLPLVEVLKAQALPASSSFPNFLPALYLSVTAFLLVRLCLRIYRAASPPKSIRREDYRGVRVYELQENKASYSFFRKIYLHPEQAQDLRPILVHEYAHSKGLHSLDLILCAIYRALFWINPICLLWERRMRENHEYIADQYVLQNDIQARDYAQVLFEASFHAPKPSQYVHAFETKSLLRKRIENLNLKNQHHMKQFLIVPALAGLGFLAVSMNTPSTQTEDSAPSAVTIPTGTPDKPAEFKGGMDALMNFIGSETKYPKALQEKGATGTVYVKFDIDAKGKVLEAQVAKSSGYADLDKEALRVVNAMPDWNPAESKGKTVRSEMTLPFKFSL